MTIKSRSLDGFRCMKASCHTTNSVPAASFDVPTANREPVFQAWRLSFRRGLETRNQAAPVAAEDSRPTCGVAVAAAKYLFFRQSVCR